MLVTLPKVGETRANILDSCGLDTTFQFLSRLFFKENDGAMFVFDITRKETFETALERYKEIRGLRGKAYPAILVGNMADEPEDRWF